MARRGELVLAKKLYNAVLNLDFTSALSLLTQNANPNVVLEEYDAAPLHIASGIDPPDTAFRLLELLLSHGADPNIVNSDNTTPLMIACIYGRADTAALLLRFGADPLIKDSDDMDARAYAFEHGFYFMNDILETNVCQWSILETSDCSVDEKNLTQRIYSVFNEDVSDEEVAFSDVESGAECVVFQGLNAGFRVSEKGETNSETAQSVEDETPAHMSSSYGSRKLPPFFPSSASEISSISCQSDRNSLGQAVVIPVIENVAAYETFYVNKKNSFVDCEPFLPGASNYYDESISHRTDGSDMELKDRSNNKHVWVSARETPVNVHAANFDRLPHTSEYLTTNNESFDSLSSNLSTSYRTDWYKKDLKDIFNSGANNLQALTVSTNGNHSVDSVALTPLPGAHSSSHEETSDEGQPSSDGTAISYRTDRIKNELKRHNINHGPVTATTKRVYYNLIKKVIRGKCSGPFDKDEFSNFPEILRSTIKTNNMDIIKKWTNLEVQLTLNFADPHKLWRGGKEKMFFTYLLLDPFITLDLPNRCPHLLNLEIWKTFILSIFYIGKGKDSRPFSHLYEALRGNLKKSVSKKISRIHSIWDNSAGVICLRVFNNVISAEAHTREAAMIEAIGLDNLTNIQSGEYYGVVKNWCTKQKQQLGVVFLYKALQIFLAEGERQIFAADLK